MKYIYLIFTLLLVCFYIYKLNALNFVQKDSSTTFFLDTSSQNLNNTNNQKMNFIQINFSNHTSNNYELLLSGKFDKTLIDFFKSFKNNTYVSVLSLSDHTISQSIYQNNISIEVYADAFNYISRILKSHFSNCIVMYERSLVPSVFRLNDNFIDNFFGIDLVYDVFGLNFSNLDPQLSVSSLPLEKLLFDYDVDLSQLNTRHLALIDIPEFMYQASFLTELSTSLNLIDIVIGNASFFRFYNSDTFLSKNFQLLKIVYNRFVFNIYKLFSKLVPVVGAHNFTGREDFSFEFDLGDETLLLTVGDDYYTDRSYNTFNYDKIYMCKSEQLSNTYNYMIYKKTNGFYLLNLDDYTTTRLSIDNINSRKLKITVPKNILTGCLNNKYQFMLEDYDSKNNFTRLHYLN